MKRILRNFISYIGFSTLLGIIFAGSIFLLLIERREDSRLKLYTGIYLDRCKSTILDYDSFIDYDSLLANKKYTIEEVILENPFDIGRDAWGNPIQLMISNHITYIWSYGPNEIDDEMLEDDLVVSFPSK